MAKLKNPLLSLDARGGLAKVVSLVKRRVGTIAERKPVPPDRKTLAQLSWRHMYQKAVALWHALSADEKFDWESQARRRHMTGYAWFMSQALKPNPGLYLPLQGGTMQGDIDMASNLLKNLLDPTLAQQPATKAYHDANKYSDAEADARIALHAAIAAAHHTKTTSAAELISNRLNSILRLPTLTTDKIWLGVAGVPTEADPPAGAALTVAQTEVYNGESKGAWTDLDLSGVVGSNPAFVILKFIHDIGYTTAFRKNGDTDEYWRNNCQNWASWGCSCAKQTDPHFCIMIVPTDDNGVIEWRSDAAYGTIIVDVIAFIK